MALSARLLATIVIVVAALPLAAQSQSQNLDPFFPGTNLEGWSEFLLFWNESPAGSGAKTRAKIYDFNKNLPPDSIELLRGPRQDATGLSLPGGDRHIDVATGDLNGDKLADIVAAWNGRADSIHVHLPHIQDTSLSWSSSNDFHITGAQNRVNLAMGNFDLDQTDEFVVAYAGADSTLHLEVYDTDSGYTPRLVASDQSAPYYRIPGFYRSTYDPAPADTLDYGTYFMTTGDVNADKQHEIILLNAEAGANGLWTVYARVFSVDGAALVLKMKRVVYDFSLVHFQLDTARIDGLDIVAQGADLDSFTGDELAVVTHLVMTRFDSTNAPSRQYRDSTRLATIRFDLDAGTMDVVDEDIAVITNQDHNLSIAVGDLNGDTKNEIVTTYGPNLRVYELDNLQLALRRQQTIGFTPFERYHDSYRNIAIGDMNADLKGELVVVDNFWHPLDNGTTQEFAITFFNTTGALDSLFLQGRLLNEESGQGSGSGLAGGRHLAVAMGDFDGDRLRLGPPTYSIDVEIQQPLVILNAAPNHFDKLGGTVYDITGCYNSTSCSFSSVYEKSTSTTVQVTSQIKADWSMDAKLTTEAEAKLETPTAKAGAKISQTVGAKYGFSFSRVKTAKSTIRINVTAKASNEDQIYGTVTDYETWEYPAYDDTGLVGYIAVVWPTVKQSRWFPAKSWTGRSYVPNHEVGNILSYLEYDDLTSNEYLDENIKVNVADAFTVGPSTSFEWSLTFEEFDELQVSKEHKFGVSLAREGEVTGEYGFDYAGIGFTVGGRVAASYSTEAGLSLLNTTTTTVQETLTLKALLGSVLGGTDQGYTVTPYSYWGQTGALVLDFAVRPEVAPAGYPVTWWSDKYGKQPDPAFIMPFRLDPEKGYALVDSTKRYLTKELLFDPGKPKLGDTISVRARVHNFSLVPIQQPVAIGFYLGDPNAGGVPITALSGNHVVLTDESFIDARGVAVVETQFELTSAIPKYARVYAVIDPGNVQTEIHEENNKAFGVLNNPDGTIVVGITDELSALPRSFWLGQNFPNPFNPSTTIQYQLEAPTHVTLVIYNVLGRKVRTLVNEARPAGDHELVWDGRDDRGRALGSGMYLYQMRTGDGVANRKMLLLK